MRERASGLDQLGNVASRDVERALEQPGVVVRLVGAAHLVYELLVHLEDALREVGLGGSERRELCRGAHAIQHDA